MAFLMLALFVGVQTPGAVTRFAPNCAVPSPDAAINSLCSAEELVRRAAAAVGGDAQRTSSWDHAAEAFRRAADLARDTTVKKFALERLELMYDEKHLNRARDADPVLRELIALNPNDLALLFRLAHLLERQEQFDAAESMLLTAHQMNPNEIEPYRELAQFFTRRATALSSNPDRQERPDNPQEAIRTDKDSIYPLGDVVQPPERVSADTPARLPADAAAAGVGGPVTVEIVVGADGRVSDARVVQSVPMLDATALATVRLWRYTPGMVEGRPVPVRMTVVVSF